jgi:hypothetical protein
VVSTNADKSLFKFTGNPIELQQLLQAPPVQPGSAMRWRQ